MKEEETIYFGFWLDAACTFCLFCYFFSLLYDVWKPKLKLYSELVPGFILFLMDIDIIKGVHHMRLGC